MKGTILIWPTQSLVEVVYTGKISFQDRCDTMADLKLALRDAAIDRFLLDFSNASAKEESSVDGLRTFIGQISDYPFARGGRVAMVNAPFEHSAATASMSKALHYSTEGFSSREAAMDWLGAQSEDQMLNRAPGLVQA